MERARFITVDGIDGVGKSTQLARIGKFLKSKNIAFITTREPGGTKTGEFIRELLLNPESHLAVEAETLLLFAARAEHLREVILPALKAGKWVLCDRFTAATYAYQGGGKGLSWEKIEALENWTQGTFRPDLSLILDAPLEVAQKRGAKGTARDRFEQENARFFAATREAYLRLIKEHPELYRRVDASPPPKAVAAQIEELLAAAFFSGEAK